MEENSTADTDALSSQSRAIRDDASRLLREYRLVEQLRQFGEVEVGGSYRWDLMLNTDIDLYVINPALDLGLAADVFLRFLRAGDFLWFAFGASVRAKPAWEVPEGYFLGMAREFNGRGWRVEVWFLRSSQPPLRWLEERMTDETRRTILHLKHLKHLGSLPVSSYQIYRAVLLGSAREADQVREWLQKEAEGLVS